MQLLIHLAGDTASSEGSCAAWADAAPVAYEPNAALVNYYTSEGDTLCGHQVCLAHTFCGIFFSGNRDRQPCSRCMYVYACICMQSTISS